MLWRSSFRTFWANRLLLKAKKVQKILELVVGNYDYLMPRRDWCLRFWQWEIPRNIYSKNRLSAIFRPPENWEWSDFSQFSGTERIDKEEQMKWIGPFAEELQPWYPASTWQLPCLTHLKLHTTLHGIVINKGYAPACKNIWKAQSSPDGLLIVLK